MKTSTLMLVALLAGYTAAYSQNLVDSTKTAPQYKNVIRYNLSGPIMFGFNYVVLGYERVLKNGNSISVNAGHAALPKLGEYSTSDATVTRSRDNTGFNISADYRIYLKKENKYAAPRGVYIGPYYSFNQFKRLADWTVKDNAGGTTNANTETNLNIHLVGFEMGYQFALGKRFTLDFVLVGPGVGRYNLNATLTGNLSAAQKEKLQDVLQEALNHKFPGMDYVFGDDKLDAQGNLNSWRLGYRYIMHIGFRL